MHVGHIQLPTIHLQYVLMRFWQPNVRQTSCGYLLESNSHFVPFQVPAYGGAVSTPQFIVPSPEPRFDLLLSPLFDTKEKSISSFASLRRNSSWLIAVSLVVKNAKASLAFTSTSANTKEKTLNFQSFVLSDSSNEIGKCLRFWLSTW